MTKIKTVFSNSRFLFSAFIILMLAIAVTRVHLRLQTTLVGYQLGSLKKQEAKLIEEQSQLKMNLAMVTSKQHLEIMAQSNLRNKDELLAHSGLGHH